MSKHKLVLDFVQGIKYLSVIDHNAKIFSNVKQAMDVFKCKSTVSVLPGTIIHCDSEFSLVDNALLLSFTYNKTSYSLSLQNGLLVVTSSTEQLISLALTQKITTSGLYLMFTQDGVQFYVSCPTSLNSSIAAAFWNTTIFQSKLTIEIRHHYYGNAATETLLNSFCNINDLFLLIDSHQEEKISKDKLQSSVQLLDQINQVYSK